MNPIVTPVPGTEQIVFEFTEEDRKLARQTRLIHGAAESQLQVAMHQICVMQMISVMLTPPDQRPTPEEVRRLKELVDTYGSGEELAPWDIRNMVSKEDRELAAKFAPPSDHPICVSESITQAMIQLNDRDDISDRQRAQLKGLADKILNTCPVKRKVTELKTKTKIEEKPFRTPEYKEAERQRQEILKPILDESKDIPFAQALKLVEQAADLFHAGTTTQEAPHAS